MLSAADADVSAEAPAVASDVTPPANAIIPPTFNSFSFPVIAPTTVKTVPTTVTTVAIAETTDIAAVVAVTAPTATPDNAAADPAATVVPTAPIVATAAPIAGPIKNGIFLSPKAAPPKGSPTGCSFANAFDIDSDK